MSSGNRKILLIDDNESILQVYQNILTTGNSLGSVTFSTDLFDDLPSEPELEEELLLFEVDTATQGLNAVELVIQSVQQQEPYAMAFVDVRMPPGIDGIETIKLIWQQDSKLQVVITTAYSDYSWEKIKEILGPTDNLIILKKPFEYIEVRQIAYMLTEKWSLARESQQKTMELECLNRTFQLFVPQQFMKRILYEHSIQPDHTVEEKLTILFTDIRSYTQFSEGTSLKENYEMLNDFFSLMEPIITQNHGFIDKFLGDGIMALFDNDQSADQAIQAAIQMLERLKNFNQARKEKGKIAIKIGIGIATGPVLIGLIGSKNRFDSTVIGDTVNQASRIEELTKKYEISLLISGKTQQEIRHKGYLLREIDTVQLRGKSNSVILYEVFDADPTELQEQKLKTKEFLQIGIILYKQLFFKEAKKAFFLSYKQHQEELTLDYMERCDWYSEHPPKSSLWDPLVNDEWNPNKGYERHGKRYKMVISCILDNGSHISGKLVNISKSGFAIEAVTSIEVGALITLTLLNSDPRQESKEVIYFSCQVLRQQKIGSIWFLGLNIL